MTFFFFLSKSAGLRNINLKLIDESLNIDFTFHLPLYIDTKDWEEEKQRPKNIYLKKYKRLNAILDKLRVSINNFAHRNSGKFQITQRALSKHIKDICNAKETVYPKDSLLYHMDSYIISKKESICKSTYKRYKVFYNLLQRFEGYCSKTLYIHEIDMLVVNKFLSFGKKEEYSENTIYRTVHFMKTILNFAERKGIHTCLRELEIRREKQQRDIITLSEEEILKIKNTQVPRELEKAKNWLLISCYTGQRVSDFMKFTTDKIVKVNGCECLGFVQQKTKKEIILPLHRTVLNLIIANNYSFPEPMDIQQYNADIKNIARVSNLSQIIEARKRKDHRTKIMKVEKWEVLSSHIGRRSFATNFYGKIPTPLLMDATGHSTEQMFLNYINPINEDRILSLSHYFDEMYKKRNSGLTAKNSC